VCHIRHTRPVFVWYICLRSMVKPCGIIDKMTTGTGAIVVTPEHPRGITVTRHLADELNFISQCTGMNRAELARTLRIGRRTLYHWEHGECMPRAGVYRIITDWAEQLRSRRQ
jgi:DNA-binding transcriptional regulator YiaG